MNHDFLKFWRVVRYYIYKRYNLDQANMELLLFLRHHGKFDKNDFHSFERVMPWTQYRLKKLIDEGWIEIFRRRKKGKRKEVYRISLKGKRLVDKIYRKLMGEEIIMSPTYNPLFKKKTRYREAKHRDAIIAMNEYYRELKAKGQPPHHAPE